MPSSVIQILVTLIQLYSLAILARILLSWFPNVDRNHPLVQVLYQITDPVLEPIRRTIQPLGMIDLSSIIVLIGLRILQTALLSMSNGL